MSYDIPRRRKVNRAAQANFTGQNSSLIQKQLDALARAGFKAPNPNFDPVADIPTKAFWYDASDASTVSLSVNNVTQWDDKSGNGSNLVQGVMAEQPLYNQTTINGKNVLTTTDLQWMSTPGNSNVNPTTFDLFIVHRPNAPITTLASFMSAMNSFNDGGFIASATPTAYLGFVSDGVGIVEQPLELNRIPVNGQTEVVELISDNSIPQSIWRIGGMPGSLPSAGNHGCAYPAVRDLYFNRFTGTQVGFGFEGDTGEILCLPRVADAVERSNILFNYLVPKWFGV
jgi:hypothetical protein